MSKPLDWAQAAITSLGLRVSEQWKGGAGESRPNMRQELGEEMSWQVLSQVKGELARNLPSLDLFGI